MEDMPAGVFYAAPLERGAEYVKLGVDLDGPYYTTRHNRLMRGVVAWFLIVVALVAFVAALIQA